MIMSTEFTFGRTVLPGIPYMPSRGVTRGVCKPRTRTPTCIIVHEPGPGPQREMDKQPGRFGDLVDAAVWLYQNKTGNNSPHYVCGKDANGQPKVVQTCPENLVAFHAGSVNPTTRMAKVLTYKSGLWNTKNTKWWLDKWGVIREKGKSVTGPLHLDGGKVWLGNRPNDNSIGIECCGDDYQNALFRLLGSIRNNYWENGKVGLTVFGHCDVDPFWRSNKYGAYDPKPERFDALQYMIQHGRIWASTLEGQQT